jgi:hypothetical protein
MKTSPSLACNDKYTRPSSKLERRVLLSYIVPEEIIDPLYMKYETDIFTTLPCSCSHDLGLLILRLFDQ